MRAIMVLIVTAATASGAAAQIFLGSCDPPQVLGFQLGAPYGVYCYPSPATCGGQLDFSFATGCDLTWAGH